MFNGIPRRSFYLHIPTYSKFLKEIRDKKFVKVMTFSKRGNVNQVTYDPYLCNLYLLILFDYLLVLIGHNAINFFGLISKNLILLSLEFIFIQIIHMIKEVLVIIKVTNCHKLFVVSLKMH